MARLSDPAHRPGHRAPPARHVPVRAAGVAAPRDPGSADGHGATRLHCVSSLLLGLERIGLSSADVMVGGLARALSLNDIRDEQARRTALRQFQAVVGILERARHRGWGLSCGGARADDVAAGGGSRRPNYDDAAAAWIENDFVKLLPQVAHRLAGPDGGSCSRRWPVFRPTCHRTDCAMGTPRVPRA